MKWLNRVEIDDHKWNKRISGSRTNRHYYFTQYLDRAAENWGALVWDDYEVLWPICYKKFPVSQVYQPLTCQQLGPLFQDKFVQSFVDEGLDWLHQRHWRVEVKFNSHYSQDMTTTGSRLVNIELPIDKPIETIRKEYNRNALGNLKKAHSKGLKVVEEKRFCQEAIDIFKATKGREIGSISSSYYEQVEAVFKSYLKADMASTWVVYLHDQAIAYALIMKHEHRLLNFFTASNASARNTGAMHLIMDTIIEKHSNSQFVFDFEGSQNENLAFFYKSFGGKSQIYLHYRSNWGVPNIFKTKK